jgi:hypothetical protein
MLHDIVVPLAVLASASYCLSRFLGLVGPVISYLERRNALDREGKLDRCKEEWAGRLAIAELGRPNVPRETSKKDIILPDDIEAYVMGWGDTWARDEERGAIRSKYLELHTGDTNETWQKVRRAVGLGEMP